MKPVLLLALDPDEYTQDNLDAVVQMVPHMQLVIAKDRERIERILDHVEIAAGVVSLDLLLRMPKLRWWQWWYAGTDWLLRHPEAAAHPFLLTNVSGVHAIPISEHILSLMLAFARHLHKAMRAQLRHDWRSPEWEEIFELAGKTVLLVGVGAIGARTAQICNALGMTVIGVRREPSAPSVPGVSEMTGPERLLDLLPHADFVVLTVPYTRETIGLIGEAELRAMRPSAYVINIGRGATIDEPALVRALQEGWIAGAGLDVFAVEPLPEDSPLWDMENVIVTCHYAGKTPHYDTRAFAIFLDNLRRYQQGEPLRNLVDKELGY
jgi:phosphoglycerate dehydrogenase-like enzyme